jgi:hypothetical protein
MGEVGVTVRAGSEFVAKTFISPTNPIEASMMGFIAGEIRRRVFITFKITTREEMEEILRTDTKSGRKKRRGRVTSWFVCLCPNWEIFSRSRQPIFLQTCF